MTEDPVIEAVEKSVGRRPDSVERLPGGANNVVAKITQGPETFLAKMYFNHPRDPRDRLGTEFATLSFLWNHGIRCIPRPIAMNRDCNLGIYQFIQGSRLATGQVTWPDVLQLCDLLRGMWMLRELPGANQLPDASEARFSARTYYDHVQARLERVEAALRDDVPSPARDLVLTQTRPAWETLTEFVEKRSKAYHVDLDAVLPKARRTISPADHGFHNTLRNSQGNLVFLDFEYAGWDQPAQMLANACLQPEIPLPTQLRRPFLKIMVTEMPGDDQLVFQLRLLYPLLSFKWSLIMLNEFLPVSGERRSFASVNAEARRAAQLEKSRRQVQDSLDAASNHCFLDDLIDELKPLPLL
jgi:hypothetical protein